MVPRARTFLLVAVLVLSSPLATGCRRPHEEGAAPSPPAVVHEHGRVTVPEGSPLRARLVVAPVALLSLEKKVEAPAEVQAEPSRLAKIAPPLPGRIVKLFVHFGDAVRAGSPLFTIDSPDLVSAQSDWLKAKSSAAQATRSAERQRDLVEHGIGAKRELEQAETETATTASELERATLRLRLLGVGPGSVGGPLTVASPIGGRVVELATAPGQYQNDPAAVLMTIADLSTVWVTANIQEKDLRRVHVGDAAKARFAAYPGDVREGHVAFVGDLLDPETRTLKARIAFDNPDFRLKPGMFATVTLSSGAEPERVVPTTALLVAGDATTLFVESAPYVFERRAVEVGEQDGTRAVITRGVEVGARVVVENGVLLQ